MLTLILAVAATCATADDAYLSPLKAIEQFGRISISDGSSFYTFSKDGSFHSGPLGISGREFDGHWTADDTRFTVIAKLDWMNGDSTGHDYRRIVFVIYYVEKYPPEKKPSVASQPHLDLWNSYFLIDELEKIPEPAASSSK